MAFYSYLSTKIIIAFITKSYQDLFGVRSYINAIIFHYICFQISRLVGLFNIGEPKQKVEFQTEMFPCVFHSIFR